MASAIATRRLRKEYLNFQKDPPPDIIAEPVESNVLTWFYAVRGPTETPFVGGVYVGKLVFPKEYPHKAPSILMLTPSGRFQVNTRLCMSMSDFHPEMWQPVWSVATILQGVVSFMASDEQTTGGLQATDAQRKRYAATSIAYNTKCFGHLFDKDMEGAFERADAAREEAAKRNAAAAKKAAAAAATTTPTTRKSRGDMKRGAGKAKEAEVAESAAIAEVKDLSPEEIEKRRIKNAKKRAKQKAKKAATTETASVADDLAGMEL